MSKKNVKMLLVHKTKSTKSTIIDYKYSQASSNGQLPIKNFFGEQIYNRHLF